MIELYFREAGAHTPYNFASVTVQTLLATWVTPDFNRILNNPETHGSVALLIFPALLPLIQSRLASVNSLAQPVL